VIFARGRHGQREMLKERIVRVKISGRVQGVCYRAWTVQEANTRGIKGWVRNRLNGDVEAAFIGAPEAVEALCLACWSGPEFAQVEWVEVVEVDRAALPAEGPETGFHQLRTV